MRERERESAAVMASCADLSCTEDQCGSQLERGGGGGDQGSYLEAGCEEGWSTGDFSMASCCERELSQLRENQRVLRILKKADVSSRKERDRRDVFAASASIPPLLTSRAEDESRLDGLDLEEEWEEEDGDLDSAFDKYRRERLAELELKKKQRERALKTGDVESVDNESLQKILKEHACVSWGQAPPKRLVCQFSVKGDKFSHELSEVIDELARGTFAQCGAKFVRIEKTKGLVINGRDQVNQAALCCFEGGQHKSVLFGEEIGAPEEVSEKTIVKWLGSCGILSKRRRRRLRGEENASGDDEYDDGEEEEEDEPCAICGRCYPHEHIKSVYGKTSDTEDDASDSDWDL